MNWVGLGTLLTAIAAVIGGLATFRGSKATGNKTVVETLQIGLAEVRLDYESARRRIDDLEEDVAQQREHSKAQDREISGLRGPLQGWQYWYSALGGGWERHRQRPAPPAPPDDTQSA